MYKTAQVMQRWGLREILIIVLLAIICWQHACKGKRAGQGGAQKADTIVVTKTTLVHDTIVHTLKVPVPQPADYVFIEAPADVDTAHILQLYYNEIYYQDNYCDTILDLYISEGISQNHVAYRDIAYQILRPMQVIQETHLHPPAEKNTMLLVGLRIGGTKEYLTTVSPEVELVTKNDRAFSVAWNFTAGAVELGYKQKISLRKKK